jgi:hypothetical protein
VCLEGKEGVRATTVHDIARMLQRTPGMQIRVCLAVVL